MDYRRTGFFCSVELQKYVVFEPYGPISHMLLCVCVFLFFLFFMPLAFVILSPCTEAASRWIKSPHCVGLFEL